MEIFNQKLKEEIFDMEIKESGPGQEGKEALTISGNTNNSRDEQSTLGERDKIVRKKSEGGKSN
jgi:hypothetical protein